MKVNGILRASKYSGSSSSSVVSSAPAPNLVSSSSDETNKLTNIMRLLSLTVNGGDGASTCRVEGTESPRSSMAFGQVEDIPDITFRATAVRESYTLRDVNQALLQALGQHTTNEVNSEFVDFVLAGCIEDELEMIRRKRPEMCRGSRSSMEFPQ